MNAEKIWTVREHESGGCDIFNEYANVMMVRESRTQVMEMIKGESQ